MALRLLCQSNCGPQTKTVAHPWPMVLKLINKYIVSKQARNTEEGIQNSSFIDTQAVVMRSNDQKVSNMHM